ncbi:hypothetical protein J2W39_005193 [Variovorax paradoxus]|uniref:Uncharacterized protein n=1 Tax=Variovorax paradoxus TaxID=34073 RepID=A0AAW8END7_VARPD|nr:hypothetical protein [Variovorax paradoxus]
MRQFAQQKAQRVDVVDQYLHHQCALQTRDEGLALERRQPAGLVGQQAGGHQGHARLDHVSDAPLREPSREVAVTATEAPVLVDHEPAPGRHFVGQCTGFGERGSQGLLAQHGQATLCRGAHDGRMEFARRRHVDRIKRHRVKHLLRARKDPGDAELACTRLGVGDVRVGDGHDHGLPFERPPTRKMVRADPTCADQAHAQGLRHGAPTSAAGIAFSVKASNR